MSPNTRSRICLDNERCGNDKRIDCSQEHPGEYYCLRVRALYILNKACAIFKRRRMR